MSTATNENKLRHHRRTTVRRGTEELKKSDARQRPANWELSVGRLHPSARRRTGQRLYGVRQVYREPPHHRNGGRYAGDGSGAPAVRGSGNGEIVGVRAFGGGHQRRLHAHHPRYGGHQRRTDAVWLNYAELLSKGQSRAALVESPLMRAMSEGRIARVEELTRIPADVQDTLITILSEKTLPIPELNDEVQAVRGFNPSSPRRTTATRASMNCPPRSNGASTRSSCPCPPRRKRKSASCPSASPKWAARWSFPPSPGDAWRRVGAQIFRELRNGRPKTARPSPVPPTGTMSTAEAISVLNSGMALAAHSWDGVLHARDVAASLVGAVVGRSRAGRSAGASTSKQWSRNARLKR